MRVRILPRSQIYNNMTDIVSSWIVPGINRMRTQLEIEEVVAEMYGIPVEKICTSTRKAEVVEARQLSQALFYILYADQGITQEFTAERYSQTHASVIHAMDKIRDRVRFQPNDRMAVVYKSLLHRLNPPTRPKI